MIHYLKITFVNGLCGGSVLQLFDANGSEIIQIQGATMNRKEILSLHVIFIITY